MIHSKCGWLLCLVGLGSALFSSVQSFLHGGTHSTSHCRDPKCKFYETHETRNKIKAEVHQTLVENCWRIKKEENIRRWQFKTQLGQFENQDNQTILKHTRYI